MAYTKTTWVNNETELNAQNMNHIEDGIENTQNIKLIAVSEEAPSECVVGDKYYNITDNLIYTATETNTWSEDGEEPIYDILYIVLSEKTTYTYDGETLLSVGGGSSDIVVVGDEPTEDTKLLIEDEDLEPQGLEIVNEYNNADNMAYSCDYSNKAFGGKILWTNPNPTSSMAANTQITLSSSDYDVYEVIFASNNGALAYRDSSKGIKGNGVVLNCNIYGGHGRSANSRTIGYVDDTHLNIEACYGFTKDSDYTDTSFCIPLYVIGYKIGLFN